MRKTKKPSRRTRTNAHLVADKGMRLRGATILKRARQAMNDGGEHWIKGTLQDNTMSKDGKHTFRYCSMGGLLHAREAERKPDREPDWLSNLGTYEIANNDQDLAAAMVTLAEVIQESLIDTSKWRDEGWDSEAYYMVSHAEGVIVNFNDAESTTWRQVSHKFRTAENRLRIS